MKNFKVSYDDDFIIEIKKDKIKKNKINLNFNIDGIYFNEEDPNDINYKPECCINIYLELASS